MSAKTMVVRFSFLCKAGVINAHSWYIQIGAATITPVNNDILTWRLKGPRIPFT
jgi:hypothetical protein